MEHYFYRKSLMILLAISITGCSETKKSEPSDADLLQGDWAGHVATQVQDKCSIAVKENQIEFRGPTPQEWYKSTYKLNEESDPKSADFIIEECGMKEYEGKVAKGIYDIRKSPDTGELTLMFASSEPGDVERPPTFGPEVRTFIFIKQ